jgi:hypothetical protein
VGAFLLLEDFMDTQTLNDSGVNQEVSGIVTPDSPSFSPDSSNTFHDLDENPEEEASSAADDKAPVDDKGKVKGGNGEDKDERFDKHPRFQQLMKERDEARLAAAKLEGRLEAAPQKPAAAPAPPPFKDVSSLSAEQIREWMEDDPKGFAENLEKAAMYKAYNAVQNQMKSKEARDEQMGGLRGTYKAFEEKNPDFRPLWDSGEIIKYIETHPGHNPMSAYDEMTGDKKFSEAIEKAKKEAEEEVTKRFQAKKKATVLSGGPAGAPRTDEDPALANTKKHGGLNAVLADKLAAMRRASGR